MLRSQEECKEQFLLIKHVRQNTARPIVCLSLFYTYILIFCFLASLVHLAFCNNYSVATCATIIVLKFFEIMVLYTKITRCLLMSTIILQSFKCTLKSDYKINIIEIRQSWYLIQWPSTGMCSVTTKINRSNTWTDYASRDLVQNFYEKRYFSQFTILIPC